MRIYIDTAEKNEVQKLTGWGCFSGITTNPIILANAKLFSEQAITDLAPLFIGDFFIQTLGMDSKRMVANALMFAEKLGKRCIIKVPTTVEGLKTIKELSGNGVWTAATAIFTPGQALLAAEAGADIVIPFYNRIEESGEDPCRVIQLINHVVRLHGKPKVVVASLKNVKQVYNILPLDVFGMTIPPSLAEELIKSSHTEEVLSRFNKASECNEE